MGGGGQPGGVRGGGLAVPRAAADCRKAWGLAHEWRIAGAVMGNPGSFPGNEDARAFAEWAKNYARRCDKEGNTDETRLPDIVSPLLKEAALRKPKLLVAYAFDVVPPQAHDFLAACAKQGIELRCCAPEEKESKSSRIAFPSAREELEAAASWARAKLEAGAKRIGVVVPELGQRRKEVARVFARVMHPARNLPAAEQKALPFNISLGAPLADYPLARAALSILELASGEIPFEQASKLIRSPFLAGAEPELSERARLDAGLRKQAPARVTLGKLVALIEGAQVLRQRLEALFALVREHFAGERSPHEWARHFSALLEAAGFPGERGLDSSEYQTQASSTRRSPSSPSSSASCRRCLSCRRSLDCDDFAPTRCSSPRRRTRRSARASGARRSSPCRGPRPTAARPGGSLTRGASRAP